MILSTCEQSGWRSKNSDIVVIRHKSVTFLMVMTDHTDEQSYQIAVGIGIPVIHSWLAIALLDLNTAYMCVRAPVWERMVLCLFKRLEIL